MELQVIQNMKRLTLCKITDLHTQHQWEKASRIIYNKTLSMIKNFYTNHRNDMECYMETIQIILRNYCNYYFKVNWIKDYDNELSCFERFELSILKTQIQDFIDCDFAMLTQNTLLMYFRLLISIYTTLFKINKIII